MGRFTQSLLTLITLNETVFHPFFLVQLMTIHPASANLSYTQRVRAREREGLQASGKWPTFFLLTLYFKSDFGKSLNQSLREGEDIWDGCLALTVNELRGLFFSKSRFVPLSYQLRVCVLSCVV